jgi:hypothetical protein
MGHHNHSSHHQRQGPVGISVLSGDNYHQYYFNSHYRQKRLAILPKRSSFLSRVNLLEAVIPMISLNLILMILLATVILMILLDLISLSPSGAVIQLNPLDLILLILLEALSETLFEFDL